MAKPQRIAVLFAVSQELAPAVRLIGPNLTPRPALAGLPLRCGRLHGRELLFVAGGMGQKRAGAASEVIVREWKPDLLIMAGVAGALSPDLGVADVVAADAVTTGEAEFVPTLQPTGSGPHHTGPLLSLDRVLVTAEDKRSAVRALSNGEPRRSGRGPLAVEMETAAVVQVAAQNCVPWAALRAVSDTAEESLPLDFNRLRTPEGDLPTSRVALAALRNPAAIPGLIRLGKNTGLAAQALATFLEGWIAEL